MQPWTWCIFIAATRFGAGWAEALSALSAKLRFIIIYNVTIRTFSQQLVL
jgi:hypothetical protein